MNSTRTSHLDRSAAAPQASGALRAVFALGVEEDFDDFEIEIKRTIERCGVLSPQLDTLPLESWD